MKSFFLLLIIAATAPPVGAQYRPRPQAAPTGLYHSLFGRDTLPSGPFPTRLYYPLPQQGFFCRQEQHFEKATRVAIHFRLGSSATYCDWMEGKSSQRFRPEP